MITVVEMMTTITTATITRTLFFSLLPAQLSHPGALILVSSGIDHHSTPSQCSNIADAGADAPNSTCNIIITRQQPSSCFVQNTFSRATRVGRKDRNLRLRSF